MPAHFSIKHVRLFALMLAGLVLIVAAHLIEPQYLSRNAKYLIKTFHAPGFAFVSLVLVWVFERHGMGRRSFAYAAIGALAFGVASELAQVLGPRHAGFDDLLRDVVGICAGLGLAAILHTRIRSTLTRRRFVLLLSLTGVALAISLRSTAAITHALLARNAALPAILSFSESWEDYLYEESARPNARIVAAPAYWPATAEESVLRSEATGHYRTFLHLRPYPNWRSFKSFSFVAASADDKPHNVTVTIRDIRPSPDNPRNSFHGRITVTPTPEKFEFTLSDIETVANERQFDFEHVDIVIISLTDDALPAILLLDDFRLR